MDLERFGFLASRKLAGEASPEEIAELEAQLQMSPNLQKEWDDLRRVYTLVGQTKPLVDALEANQDKLPEYRLNQLRSALRKEFQVSRKSSSFSWRWALPSLALVTCVLLVILNFQAFRPAVEIGLIDQPVTRSSPNSLKLENSKARVVTFQNEQALEAWKIKPLSFWQKGRIWIDEENDLIHLETRKQEKLLHQTFPLPKDNVNRSVLLKEIVHSAE
jgi:hypothetical protein